MVKDFEAIDKGKELIEENQEKEQKNKREIKFTRKQQNKEEVKERKNQEV